MYDTDLKYTNSVKATRHRFGLQKYENYEFLLGLLIETFTTKIFQNPCKIEVQHFLYDRDSSECVFAQTSRCITYCSEAR